MSRLLLPSCRITTRKACFFRSLSSVQSRPEIQNSVFISQSTDPLFNLTFEDWLFRHSPPDKPLLFLYRNTPCVVIGRNQNPWKEANMQALRTRDVPLLRRRSGGGTVYHDLGNTNFSIHLARRAFDRHATSQLVLRAVMSLDVAQARLNDRNDICVADDKMSSRAKYVSGSAYKIVSARAYHHGTMLISTRLDALGDLLRVDKPTMVTAGVASVRSPVRNLQQTSPHIEHTVFMNAVVDEFRREYAVNETDDPTQYVDESARALPYIQNGIAELKSWDWLYGQTPEFTYTIEQAFAWGSVTAELRAKHGVIISCALHAPTAPPDVSRLLEQLGTSAKGERYGSWPPPRNDSNSIELGEVTHWLVKMLN
ncbi:Lipoyltransferase and lipoate-protein ligase [Mycena galopus ATCC 62051]|nr:Lipoyltransferase and lipoate-protein ligase [Mycena galopus ATCC 62051]